MIVTHAEAGESRFLLDRVLVMWSLGPRLLVAGVRHVATCSRWGIGLIADSCCSCGRLLLIGLNSRALHLFVRSLLTTATIMLLLLL